MTIANPRRRALAGAAALLVVAGCAVPTPSVSTPPTQASSATPATGPATSVVELQREDSAFGDIVTSTGLDSGTAAFMMLAGSTLNVVDGHTFVARQDFPNGATAKAAYHLYAGSDLTPGQRFVVSSTRSEDTFRFSLSYALSIADLPADLRQQVLAGLPGSVPAQPARDSALAAIGLAPARAGAGRAGVPAAPMEGEPSTVGVLVDGVISQAVESGIDKAVNTTKLDKTLAGTSCEAYKSGKKVWDALEANELVADALTRIAAARDCAENPTNPLTKADTPNVPEPGTKSSSSWTR